MPRQTELIITTADISDVSAICTLCENAVKHIAKADYSEEQIKVWSRRIGDLSRMQKRVEKDYFIQAKNEHGQLAGISSLRTDGYVDLLYVSPNFSRKGVATTLLQKIIEEARQLGLTELTADASTTAIRSFEKCGFKIGEEQHPVREGVELVNYKVKLTFDE